MSVAIQLPDLKAHPAADLFPILDGEDFDTLVESMRKGFDVSKPILRYRGEILDGRNRLRAAIVAGIKPVFEDVPEDRDPYQESWRHNAVRRHLTPLQKAAICAKVTSLSLQWQTEREDRVRRANEARAEKAKAQHAVSNPRAGETSGRSSREDPPKRATDNRTVTVLAEKAGVSRSTMERALRLQKDGPEHLDAAIRGERQERRKPAPAPPTERQRERDNEVARLYSFTPAKDIATKLGVHESWVRGSIKRQGLQRGKTGRKRNPLQPLELGLTTIRGQFMVWTAEDAHEDRFGATPEQYDTTSKIVEDIIGSARALLRQLKKERA